MSPNNPPRKVDAFTDKRSILCMEHCRDYQIFGFDIPRKCTKCGTNLTHAEFHIPPFRIPSPLSNAAECPCAIVLKPTNGTFLSDYKPGDDLHIAITSSLGAAHEYDHNGLRSGTQADWTQCIHISMKHIFKTVGHQPHDSLIRNHWDAALLQMTASTTNEWSKESYNEWTHNCYSFVLHFLQTLYHRLCSLSIPLAMNFSSISTTERFCEEFILEKTKLAGKYIALHRQLVSNPKHAS